MSQLMLLVLLSLIMFAGAFAAGLVPLSRSFSAAQLRLMTAAGAGLLLGTALLIIIPEAVATLHGAHNHDDEAEGDEEELVRFGLDPYRVVGMGLVAGFLFMLLVENLGLPHAVHRDDCPGHAMSSVAVVGLVIHAAIDGVALGAAAASEAHVELG